MKWILAAYLLLLTGCVPARTPPQLEHTPGAYIALDGTRYDAAHFSVHYPDGWRVVKLNTAAEADRVVFAAPNELSTITVIDGALQDFQSDPAKKTDLRSITFDDGRLITIIGAAPEEQWEDFQRIFDQVVTTIVPRR